MDISHLCSLRRQHSLRPRSMPTAQLLIGAMPTRYRQHGPSANALAMLAMYGRLKQKDLGASLPSAPRCRRRLDSQEAAIGWVPLRSGAAVK